MSETVLTAGLFETRMTSRPTDPPITWQGWWRYDQGKGAVIDGIGPVVKIFQDEVDDSDSYSYGSVRTMVFRVSSPNGTRWFRVVKSSNSFDSAWDEDVDEAWEYPSVEEVFPEEVSVTRWRAV